MAGSGQEKVKNASIVSLPNHFRDAGSGSPHPRLAGGASRDTTPTGAAPPRPSGIAVATLVPMMNGLTGQSPYIPPLVYGSFAGSVLVLGLAATALPARAALRRP